MEHSNLKLLIKASLPKEIQDLIGEFNVEHRYKMKKVFNYINDISYN